MDLRVFMPGATEWLCRYCNERFWWTPGNTGLKRPSQCACGEIKEPIMFMQLIQLESKPNE